MTNARQRHIREQQNPQAFHHASAPEQHPGRDQPRKQQPFELEHVLIAETGRLEFLNDVANAGRNTQAAPPIDNIDFSLIKHFAVRERFKIELAGQAFNVFNHPQFIPGGSINNANTANNFLGNVQAYVTVSNPLFNNPTNTFSSNPRVLQITAKFHW